MLNMQNNEIDFLSEKIFEKLSNLKRVILDFNKLSVIPPKLFQNNLKLEDIYLKGNKIQIIVSTMFDHLSLLDYVDFNLNVCVNTSYYGDKFTIMKNDLMQKCQLPV